jgi:anhydro-N-acetylmuramic acid kinase
MAYWLGLISGTSADAIDAALVTFEPQLAVVATLAVPYPDALRDELLAVAQGTASIDLDAFAALDVRVGHAFAGAALSLLQASGAPAASVRGIGSHGQTLRHRPHGPAPFTLQIGDPNVIAERTRITTVADFRRRDVAAGGQGAPLLPPFHAACFSSRAEDRIVLNLGGIANVTLLPRDGTLRGGYDTGPASALLDAWASRHLGARYDADGAWARGGTVVAPLLDALRADPYFAAPAPKSTGRETLHLAWVASRARDVEALAPQDVQRTLVELTARTVGDAVRASQPATRRVIACGGGVRSSFLMERIAAQLGAGIALESSAAHGVDPDFVEAAAFAWLARERLEGRPGNRVEVTGAAGPRVLGAVYSA